MRGFTLVETLVAVLFLTVAIAGPLTIASKGIQSTMIAKDQFTAYFLAQDAIEWVRFARDSACLNAETYSPGPDGCPSAAWLATLSLCTSDTGSTVCNIDSVQGTTCTPGTPSCGVYLRYNPTENYYTYNTIGSNELPQKFKRTVSIQYIPGADEATVTVNVYWNNQRGVERAPIILRETLFRWQ